MGMNRFTAARAAGLRLWWQDQAWQDQARQDQARQDQAWQGQDEGQPRPETRQTCQTHHHQHNKMVKVSFVPLNTYTSAKRSALKHEFSASLTHHDQWGVGANRPSRRQAHADASQRRRQPCRRTPGQRPKPGRHQDDQHGHHQRDEGGLLWCNLAAQTSF